MHSPQSCRIGTFVALCVMLVADAARSEKHRVGAVPFPVVGQESDQQPQNGEAMNVAYLQCNEKHEDCADHCRNLEDDYVDGRCVGDVCLCRYQSGTSGNKPRMLDQDFFIRAENKGKRDGPKGKKMAFSRQEMRLHTGSWMP